MIKCQKIKTIKQQKELMKMRPHKVLCFIFTLALLLISLPSYAAANLKTSTTDTSKTSSTSFTLS